LGLANREQAEQEIFDCGALRRQRRIELRPWRRLRLIYESALDFDPSAAGNPKDYRVDRRCQRNSRAVPTLLASGMSNPFRYFNSSPDVIRRVVMMYVQYPLRNVGDLLAEHGIDISHETVRFWWNRFGPMFAAEVCKRRVVQMRGYPQWRWHLDECS
jgi:hypothetical protein